MPANGAMLLSDVTTDKLRFECACGLRKQYDVAALRTRIGNTGLPQLLDDLAKAEGCQKVKDRFHDRCMARFVGLPWQA